MNKSQGKLVVIEGIDGSGKTTQIELLKRGLALQGVALEAVSFPRYEDNTYGRLIRRYLEGEFGQIGQIDPHFLALAYAGDRSLAKTQIEQWLSGGKLVLANRYVSSSKAHLAANLPIEKREEFIQWIDELEYQTLGMPREDLTILLSVNPKLGQKNAAGEGVDIHEDDIRHLEEADKIYGQLARENNWQEINCMQGEKLRTPEDIHQQLLNLI